MDRPDAPPTATEVRLVGFGVALAGAVAGTLAALGGYRSLAVAVGLRVTGVGLSTMGAATVWDPATLAGVAGREVELVRGVVLFVAGAALVAVPWTVVGTVAG